MALKALSNVTQGGSAFPKLPSSLSRSSELTQTLPLDSEAKATIRVNIGVTAGGISVIARSATASITIGATASGETFTLHAGVASCQVNLSASAAGFNTSTQVPDETSNGNDMVLLNDPTFVTDAAVGTRSTDFDSASSQAGRIDNNFESTFQSPFSLSVWTKPDDGVLSGSNEYIFPASSGTVSGVENWRWDLRQVGGKLRVSIIFYSGSSEIQNIKETTNNVYSDGTQSAWTHVVVTVSSSAVPTIYVNGSAVALSTISSASFSLSDYDSTNDCVGIAGVLTSSSDTTPIYEYNGKLDDIALWSTELTSTQASNLYNSGNGTNLEGSSNLAGWWKMGEHSVVPITYSGTATCSVTITTAANGDLLELHSGAATCSINVTASASGDLLELHSGSATVSVNVTASANGTAFTAHSGTASCQVNLSASASGTVTAPSAWSNDYSISLDGTDDYLSIGNPSDLQITGNMTISAWFKTSSGSNNRIIDKDGGGGQPRSYILLLVSNKLRWVRFNSSGTGYTIDTVDTFNDNAWHHVVVTNKTSGTIDIYVDGTALTLGTGTGNYTNVTSSGNSGITMNNAAVGVNIGYFAATSSQYFDGLIDEVAIWDDVLTSSEVTAIYNNGAPTDLTTDAGNYASSANLQGHWRMEEGSGTSVADSSSNSNAATLNNSPTFSTDVPAWSNNYSLDFDGTNDYLSTSLVTNTYDLKNGFSASLWVKLDDVSTTQDFFGRYGASTGRFYFGITGSNVRAAIGTSFDTSTLSHGMATGVWYHVAYTFSGGSSGTFTYYLNGSSVGTISFTWTSDSGSYEPMHIGGLKNGSNLYQNPTNGKIDEFALYDSTLSASDITAIYNSGAPANQSSDSNLVAYWRMEENTGTTVADSSSNSNTATLNNGPTFSTDVPVFNQFSINLDGSNDYLKTSFSPSGIGTGDYSIAFWFNMTSGATEDHPYFLAFGANASSTTNTYQGLGLTGRSGDGYKVRVNNYYGSSYTQSASSSTSDVTAGTWYHFLLVRSGNTLTLYKDGSSFLTLSNSDVSSNDLSLGSEFRLGYGYGAASRYVKGLIDEAAVWDVALSSSDATAIYNSGTPNDLTTSGSYDTDRSGDLQFYWRMEENTGTSVTDTSGNGNTATLTNGPTFSTTTP